MLKMFYTKILSEIHFIIKQLKGSMLKYCVPEMSLCYLKQKEFTPSYKKVTGVLQKAISASKWCFKDHLGATNVCQIPT